MLEQLSQPIRLLTMGERNSLAASLEILTYLQAHDLQGEIIHGELDYIAERLTKLQKISECRRKLDGAVLGVIGNPSDWLIASQVNAQQVYEKLGCKILDLPIEELIQYSKHDYAVDSELVNDLRSHPFSGVELQKALNIYGALNKIIKENNLKGLTVRCFDLLNTLESTSCIALALLNAQGLPSACEGDVPALLSMLILQSLLGEPGFMVNPSRISVQNNRMVVAHCTLPINMCKSYSLKTHYESGIGVAVDGDLPKQKAMIFKVSADLKRYFLSEIEILANLSEKNLCRTQIEIQLAKDVHYFLNQPCGNHHIIVLQDDVELVREFMATLECEPV
jgi:L-fucose isomerase-like protein